jgi:hypothetical protein
MPEELFAQSADLPYPMLSDPILSPLIQSRFHEKRPDEELEESRLRVVVKRTTSPTNNTKLPQIINPTTNSNADIKEDKTPKMAQNQMSGLHNSLTPQQSAELGEFHYLWHDFENLFLWQWLLLDPPRFNALATHYETHNRREVDYIRSQRTSLSAEADEYLQCLIFAGFSDVEFPLLSQANSRPRQAFAWWQVEFGEARRQELAEGMEREAIAREIGGLSAEALAELGLAHLAHLTHGHPQI